MKKYLGHLIISLFLTLIVGVFLSSNNAIAQTVTIGTGTAVNSSTSYPAPYGNWYYGAKHQFLIRASELTANCAIPGNITALGFDVATVQGTPLQSFTIRIKSTSATVLNSTFDNTGFVTVFGPVTYTETLGWNMHPFSTPFLWNGTSNLLVEVCFNNTSYVNNAITRYSTTSFNSCLWYRADNSSVCPTATGTVDVNRPNIRLSMTTTSSPIIKPSKSNIDFGITYLSYNKKDSVYLKDIGCSPVIVSNITKQTSNFSLSTTSGTINNGDSMKLVITFTPPAVGTYYDTINVFTNAGDSLIPIVGQCLLPPAISTNPTQFNVTINSCNDSVSLPLTINNTGASSLNYSISTQTYALYDGFESGNISGWTIGSGSYARNVVTTEYANGLRSFQLIGGNSTYRDGIHRTFTPTPATSVSFKLMSPIGSTGDNCDVNVGNTSNIASGGIADTWIDNGGNTLSMWCNSGTYAVPLTKGQWYKVEYRNINYSTKKFDYYVDNILVASNLSFWNASITNIDVIYLFGYSASQTSYFDEIEIITNNTSWITATPVSGNVPASGSSIVSLKFKSNGLTDGIYNTSLYISSNDPINPLLTIPATLTVNGTPNMNITLADVTTSNCLDLDSIMESSSSTDTLYIHNAGCDTLFIDNLNITGSNFSVLSYTDTLPAQANGNIIVSFNPSGAGVFNGFLSVLTNDIDTTICLSGIAFNKPVLCWNPDTIIATAVCNQTINQNLNLCNSGLGNLYYELSIGCGPPIFSESFESGNTSQWQTGTCGFTYSFPSGGAPHGNKYLQLTGGCNNHYQGLRKVLPSITPTYVSFYTKSSVNNVSSNYFLLGNNPISSQIAWFYFRNDGQMGLTGGSISKYVPYVANQWYHIEFRNINFVNYTFDFYIDNVLVYENYPFRTNLNNIQSLHIYNYNSATTYFDNIIIGNCNIPSWLTTNPIPQTDTIPPSGNVNYTVGLNSTGLISGQYTSNITITSNDPVQSTLSIPVILNVNGSPDMQVTLSDITSPSCLDLDSIMENTTSIDSIIVNNTGCDTLFIDNLNISPSVFSIVSSNSFIPPWQTGKIRVRFSPASTGVFTGSLVINTNDIDTTICLKGKAFSMPVSSYNPEVISAVVGCNNTYTDEFTIYNTGLNSLIYTTSFIDTLKSALLNGTNNYITTPLNINQETGSPGITMEAWVYPTSISSGNHFVISSDNGGFDWSILRTAGNWYVYTGAATINTGFTVDVNKWQHIAAVFIPGTGVRFYKNGQLFSTVSIGLDVADNNINIGRLASGGSYFDGRIDEVRIWNTQRSQANIISIMGKKLQGNENGLLCYMNFDNNTAYDFSDNGNNGTLYNTPFVINQPNAPVTPSWLTLSNIGLSSDTIISNDSTQIGVAISTFNQTIGQYTEQILINSNDPLNSPDSLTINLSIVGAPNFVFAGFEDTITFCLNLDTVMAYTNSRKNVFYTNNGCDTLWIDSVKCTPPAFSFNSATPYVLPGDTGIITIEFLPASTGTFNGIANIYTNETDTSVCLYGFSSPRPILSVVPDTFHLTINCNTLYTDSFALQNNGLVPLNYNTGNSGVFDGVNNFVLMNNSADFDVSRLTMEAWVYSDNFNHNGFIFEKGPVNTQYSIFFEGANFCFRTCPTTGGYDSYYLNSASIGLTNGSWHHVAATYDGAYKRVYVDGILAGQQAYNKNLITGKLGEIIGAYGGTGAHLYYFNGRIDEVRVWNLARSQAQIIASMNAPLTGLQNGLIGYWNFDNGSANDLSGHGHNGTYTNGAVASPPNFNTVPTPSWLSWTPVQHDTIAAGNSAYLPFTINTSFQTLGNYSYPIIVNTNDPLHYLDSLIIDLNLVGNANFAFLGLEDTIGPGCLDHDTIMEFTNNTRNIFYANTGCDTLWVDSVVCSPAAFSYLASSPYVLPGDSGFISIKFEPQSTGIFNGAANIYTNELDTVICLRGFAYPRPIISANPDTLNITLSCSQTVTDTIILYNNGLTNLIYNIDTTNYCVFLDGTGDYLRQTSVTLPTGSSDLTIEAWIYPTGYNDATYNGVVSWGGRSCTGNGVLLSIQNNGRPSMATWCNDFTPSSGPVAALNSWNHIAMVLSGQNVTLYINGQPVSGTLPSIPIFSSANLAIGSTDFPGRYFKGKIDEVKIWNVPRSTEEVNNDMFFNVYGNEPGLISYWDFEDQTANDVVGSNNTILQGNASVLQSTSPFNPSSFTILNGFNDTLAYGDSSIIPIHISSAGLLTGTYHDSLVVYNNDPLSNPFIVPINVFVVGTPDFVFTGFSDTISNTCLNLDSIMEFTTSNGEIYFTNTGCDTLWVDSLVVNPSGVFSVSSSPLFVAPGDTGTVVITFAPVTTGSFIHSLYLYSNGTDTSFCLKGMAYPKPVLTFSPDTLNLYLNACQDSVSGILNIYNTGLSNLNWVLSSVWNKGDDFDPVIDNSFWSINNGFISANCGSMIGNALYFNDAGVRQAQTIDLSTIGGGTIKFALHIGNGGSCEYLDSGEDLVLEYSNNSGGSWTNISTFYSGTYASFTNVNLPIPAGARTMSTRFRWRQLSHSGTCCDHWAIDNVLIDINGNSNITFTPNPGTTLPSGTTQVIVQFSDSGFVAGNYVLPIIIQSNDPINSIQFSYLTVQIDSLLPAPPAANDAVTCFGMPTPPLIASGNSGDTIKWYNSSMSLIHTGDTLYTGQTVAGIYKYYLSSIDSLTGCESQIDSVFLTINNAPVEPVVSDVEVCFGSPVPPLVSTGNLPLWYSNPSLNTIVNTGLTFNTMQSAPGVYTYYIADSIGGCPKGPVDTASLIIYSLPNKPVANDQTACVGGVIPALTATVTGTDSIRWYNFSLGYVGSGFTYNTGQTSQGVYIYFVTSVDTVTGCESLRDTVMLSITNTPAPVTSNVSACFGSPATPLTATGTNISWYNSSMTLVYSGSPFATGETAVGTYNYYVTQTVNGCESTPFAVSVVINPIPSVPVSPDKVSCFGQTTPALTATGTNINWYSDPALTTMVGTGSPFNTGMTPVGSYTFYVTQTVSGCPSQSDTVLLTIQPIPSRPIVANQLICFGNPTPNLVATGITGSDTVHWYSNSTLTTLAYTGNPFATGQTAVGVYTYYVTQADTVTGCSSQSDTASLTINGVPMEPTANDVSVCSGSPAILTSTGTMPLWYNNVLLTPVVFTGNNYNTGLTIAGTYTFYISDSIPGCPPGPADTAILTINPTPPLPPVSPQQNTICLGDPTPSFTATGSNIEWWSNPGLTSLLYSGNPFTPAITTPGNYVYYVTQTINSCRSIPDTAYFTINFAPVPVANNVTVPSGSPVPDLTSSGTNVQWYDTSNTLVYSGNIFATGNTAVGQYTYYVSQTLNGCESAFDTVVMTILPGAPVGTNASVCEGSLIPDLTAVGSNLNWYSDPWLTVLTGTGSPFATGQTAAGTYTYYVTQTVNSIESPSDTVTLVINPIPPLPVASYQSTCFGNTVPNLTATGTNIQWYDNSMNLIFIGSSFSTGQTAAGTYIYFVTQTINGCESAPRTDSLVIHSLPSAPNAGNDTAICYGDPSPNLSATGSSISWYNNSGVLVGTGNTYPTGQTNPGSYSYYATQTDTLTGCESIGDTTVLTINSTLPPVAQDEAVCFGSPVPSLSATGTNIQWFDSTMTPVFTGNTFNTGQTAVGTYTYYISQTNTVTGCTSQMDTVLLIISSPPTVAPTVANAVACFGSTIPDLVATTGSIINWYTDATLLNQVFSGNPFATGLTAVGTYTFYAADSTASCSEGPSTSVTLTINPAPATLSVNDTFSCFGAQVPEFIASGTNVQWYDTSMTLLYSGNTFSPGQTSAGIYTYLVTQTDIVTSCSSIPDSVTLTIHALPAKPVSLDTTVCSASVIPDLTATGTNVQWYNSSGTLVYTGNTFATGITSTGIYNFYVSQINPVTGCESAKDTSTLSVLTSPPVPVANDVAVCVGNPVPPLSSSGTNVIWYSDGSLNTLVHTGNTFNTGITTVGSYTFYVTDSLSGCVSSAADTVTLFINPIPYEPVGSDLTFCYGNNVVLNSTGSNPQWYTDGTLINMVGTGNSFNLGIKPVGHYTYYVSDYAAGCGKSPADTVTLIVNPRPLVTANTFSTSITPGDSVTLIAYNAQSYDWNPPAGLNTNTGPIVIASPSVSTTYTVTGTNVYGCSSDTSIFVLLNPIGINENNISVNDLMIYPNPASRKFTIEFTTYITGPIHVYLNNIIGEKILIVDIKENSTPGLKKYKYEIPTGMYADGFYSIEIMNNLGTLSRKIVLKK